MKQKSEKRTVYIIKYWYKYGIVEAELEIYDGGWAVGRLYNEPGYLSVNWTRNDYELTMEAAKKRVCLLADRKIRSWERQILKARKQKIKYYESNK